MPRPKKKNPKPAHRPQKEIDWNLVDEMLEAHCTGTQVAAVLGIHVDTLYIRTQQEKGTGFSDYSQSKKEVGKSVAHRVQYNLMKEGNTTAMAWWCANKMSESTKVRQEIEVQESPPSAVKLIPKKQLAIPDDGNCTIPN